MKTLCLYAIVRFMPYAETQEFANVGVVMCVPDKNIFKFRLAPKRFARITQFFDDLDGTIYKAALQVYEAELMRIENYVKNTDAALTANIFQELTRHREGVIYFGNTRTAFIDDVNTKLDTLFEHYVKRAFANEDYIEKVLEKRVKDIFHAQHIVGFKKQKLHTRLGGFDVPFVRKIQDRTQVIKPLAFAQKTPLLAYEHARNWADRLYRFADNAEQGKDNILFAVQPPTEKAFATAFNEALELIVDKGMQTAANDKAIIEFATRN